MNDYFQIYFLNLVISLFVMIDPLAAIPMYLTLTHRFNERDTLAIRRRAVLTATGILCLFGFLGVGVLKFFGISIAALRIGGGILLLIIALEQVIGHSSQKVDQNTEAESLNRDEIAVVPLAVPLLAGPGAISTAIVAPSWAGKHTLMNLCILLLSIFLVMLITYLTLKWSQKLYLVLGKIGLNLLSKIMGILVTAIAVEYIIEGIHESFPKFGL